MLKTCVFDLTANVYDPKFSMQYGIYHKHILNQHRQYNGCYVQRPCAESQGFKAGSRVPADLRPILLFSTSSNLYSIMVFLLREHWCDSNMARYELGIPARLSCLLFKRRFQWNRKTENLAERSVICTLILEIIINIEIIDINNYIVLTTGFEVFKIYDPIRTTFHEKPTFSKERHDIFFQFSISCLPHFNFLRV